MDLLLPKQAHYQAVLRPEYVSSKTYRLSNCYNHHSLWPIKWIEQPRRLYDHHRSCTPVKKQLPLFQLTSNVKQRILYSYIVAGWHSFVNRSFLVLRIGFEPMISALERRVCWTATPTEVIWWTLWDSNPAPTV